MATYKCKKCGNIIEVENGAIIAVCDNCLLAQPINAGDNQIVPENETVVKKSDVSSEIRTLLKRVYLFLEDEEWEKADEYCEKILDINPEFAEAYLGKIMTEFRVRKREDLINCEQSIKGNKYDKIMRFGDDKIKVEIKSVADEIENRIAPKTKLAEKYEKAVEENKPTSLEGKKKTKKILIISVAVLLVVAVAVSGVLVWRNSVTPVSPEYNPIYSKAVGFMEAGRYSEAISIFTSLNGYKDSKEKIAECKKGIYNLAVEAEKDSDKATAAILFGQAGDYKDAEERSFALWDEIAVRETISACDSHTVGLKKDGTVVAVGRNDSGQCDVEGWKDIVAISADSDYTVGLKKDGTVVAVGRNTYGECDVENWKDIVAISAAGDYTAGLKKDGTVIAVGHIGKFVLSDWEDIVAISAEGFHMIGLKSDGTVVTAGPFESFVDEGQCDIKGWKDIVAISANSHHTVGLKKDGTVVSTKVDGFWDKGQDDVSNWKDIVAVSAGFNHTVGLKKDGTVVAVGDIFYGQCDVENWKDIVAISAGQYYTVGLKKDGTVVATTHTYDETYHDYYGQSDVEGWSDIKTP